jgi:hypothetical protein
MFGSDFTVHVSGFRDIEPDANTRPELRTLNRT